MHALSALWSLLLLLLLSPALAQVDWASLTADDLAALPASDFETINDAQLATIPADACTGFALDQIVSLNVSACGGFIATQVANIPAPAFLGWNQSCIRHLNETAFSQVTSDQIGSLTPTAAGGLSYGVVHNLPAAAGAGWTADNLAGVRTGSELMGCAGFEAPHVATMLADAFQGWTADCVQWLGNGAWSQTTAAQIAALNGTAVSKISGLVLGAIPGHAAAGWNNNNLPYVYTGSLMAGCAGFTENQVGNMTLVAFGSWTKECVEFLPSPAFSKVSAEQIGNFSVAAAPGLPAAVVQNIPPAAAAGVTSTLLAALGGGCGGLTLAQITQIPVAQYTGFTADCVSLIKPQNFAEITLVTLQNFPDGAYPGFTAAQFAQIPSSVLETVDLPKLKLVTSGAISGLSSSQLAGLVNTLGTAFIRLWNFTQINGFPSTNLTKLFEFKSFVPATVPYAFDTVPSPYTDTTWLQVLLTSAVAIPADTLTQFDANTIWGITAAQAAIMPADSVHTLATLYLSTITPDTMGAFNCDQLAQFAGSEDDQMIPETREVYHQNYTRCHAAPTSDATSGIHGIGEASTSTGTGTGEGSTSTTDGSGTGTGEGSTTQGQVGTSTTGKKKLGGGAVAGIVITVLLVVGAGVAGGVFYFRRRQQGVKRGERAALLGY